MPVCELSIVALLGAYVLIRIRRGAAPGPLLLQLVGLATSAWIADALAIRIFAQHNYSGDWTWWADTVPAVAPLGWALLILSAWDLGRSVVPSHSRLLPWLTAAVVVIDVSVIGPLGALLGAWQFADPNLFGISPATPVAVAGATAYAVALWELLDRRAIRYWFMALTVVGGTATALLIGWATATFCAAWLPAHPIFFLAIAWLVAALSAALVWAEGWQLRRLPDSIGVRFLVSFSGLVLIALFAEKAPVFVVFCLAPAMLYASLTPWPRVYQRLFAKTLLRYPVRLMARQPAADTPSQRPRAA